MKKIIALLILLTFLSACAPAMSVPTPNPTPLPTATPIPEPITGTFFWDANGSGLMDETSFIIPDFDSTAPPYFFQLLAANGTGLGNLSPGELATVPEPPIPGIGVCLGDICTETGADGTFTLEPVKTQDTHYLKFADPNSDDPTRAFRYINQWNGPVVIESNEMNGVTVPEQHLNDTKIVEISNQFLIDKLYTDIGLMQGFLTLPFDIDSDNWLLSYVDLDHNLGSRRNYLGEITDCLKGNYKPGTCDNHQGVDWGATIGTPIFAMQNGKVIDVWEGENNTAKQIRILHNTNNSKYSTDYGHNSLNLVSIGEIFTGQIIGLVGNTGCDIPHLHFNFWPLPFSARNNGDVISYIFEGNAYPKVMYHDGSLVNVCEDPFRDLFNPDSFSYWTIDNIPQFPHVEIIE